MLRHQGGGFPFLPTEFRIPVQMVTNLDDFGQNALSRGFNGRFESRDIIGF